MRSLRVMFAVVLGGLVTLVATAQTPPPPPPGTVAQPMPKEGMDKDKKPEWPKEIGGRGPSDYVKDLSDPDPHIRNVAFQTLPKFGPDAQAIAGRPIVKALEKEIITAYPAGKDVTVIAAGINAIKDLGLSNDTDIKDACRLLNSLILLSPNKALYRQYAIPTLAAFGRKAENGVTTLTQGDVIQDPSYEIRRLAANSLYYVGQDEHRGPTVKALDTLTTYCIKDVSAAVRVEAFQTLVMFGPPILARSASDTKPPEINKDMARRYLGPIKNRLAIEKDKQVEAWARLAVMRFDPDKEINDKNLTDLAQIIAKGNSMAKVHGLNAIALLGERAEKQLKTILEQLRSDDPAVVDAAVNALVAMPLAAKPNLPEIKSQLEKRPEEYFKELLKVATKLIEEAKPPGSPSDTPAPTDPAMPPKK